MRLKCSALNAHLHKIGVLEIGMCACGEGIEDIFHFFFSCKNYQNQRDHLQMTILPVAPFTLNTVLNEECPERVNSTIFQAVHKYLKETERFP